MVFHEAVTQFGVARKSPRWSRKSHFGRLKSPVLRTGDNNSPVPSKPLEVEPLRTPHASRQRFGSYWANLNADDFRH
jgi:hypothetical protein